ncbi:MULTISPECIES: hypothetical protein [Ensifer]|uniref:hypothetical protein n=1 Tax=Ensifer TaxID=106591 RepID=UPI0011461437|nr:hypothetical protein [Ensifer adhaerens]
MCTAQKVKTSVRRNKTQRMQQLDEEMRSREKNSYGAMKNQDERREQLLSAMHKSPPKTINPENLRGFSGFIVSARPRQT